jgi:spoIIIJ-associated protein
VEWVETTGKTVEEAREAALDQLGVDEQDAEVVIVEEGKSALFGLRKSDARVRARVRPTRPRPKRQQRDRRGGGGGGGRNGASRGGERTRSGRAEGAAAADGSDAPVAAAARAGEGAEASTSGEGAARRSRRRRGGRSGGAGSTDGATAADTPDELDGEGASDGAGAPGEGRSQQGRGRRRGNGARRQTTEGSSEVEEEQMPIEEQAELAERFVRGVVQCFGLQEATTSIAVDDPLVEVAVSGEGLGLLIGPHGSTLAALQELTRTVVQRRGSDHGTRIVVDVAGYRAKRAAALAGFARQIAAEVLETGTSHSLEPMSASDRKIVHDTVNEIEGVATSSEGEEEHRHVVIHIAPTAAGHELAEIPVASTELAEVDAASTEVAGTDVEAPATAGEDESG